MLVSSKPLVLVAWMAAAAIPLSSVVAAPKKPAPAEKPAPAAPVKPTAPAPAKPASPAPVKPAGQPGAAAGDPRQQQALIKAIATKEKSEQAGNVFRKFLEGKTAEDRLGLVLEPEKNAESVKTYFASSPNREFTAQSVQILGSVSPPNNPALTIFPYFIATDKNSLGFITAVVETPKGFKVDWPSFMKGHDDSLEKFLEKKSTTATTFLVGIEKTHVFGDNAALEGKNIPLSIQMPPPVPGTDPTIVWVEKASAVGKTLDSKLGWAKGHLCFLTIAFEGGEKPVLRAKNYEPYAK